MAEFAHNLWKHESSKYSPHELMTGSIPSAKITPLNDTVSTAQSRLIELADAWSNTQISLQKQLTHSRVLRILELNQKVWLDGCNLRTKASTKKLALRRYKLFKVTQKISSVNYRLELPRSMGKIRNVFHIDLLVPFNETDEYGQAFSQPPSELIDGEKEYEVEEIIKHCRSGRNCKQEYLIKWKWYPASDNTWIKKNDLHAPELLVEYEWSLKYK